MTQADPRPLLLARVEITPPSYFEVETRFAIKSSSSETYKLTAGDEVRAVFIRAIPSLVYPLQCLPSERYHGPYCNSMTS